MLIAGGGVAGLETLLALRALAADRVDITILAPELKFVNRSMAVDQPFKRQRARGIRLQDTAAELDARWHHGALDRVEHEQHRVVTKDGDELLLRHARARHRRPRQTGEWTSEGVLTYHGGRDGPSYRLLLHQLHEGRVTRLAFVKPAGASWPLPLYDLALMTAAECAAHDLSDVELSLITPEDEPLGDLRQPGQRRDPPPVGRLRVSRCTRAATASRVVPDGWTSRPASGACPSIASSPSRASSAHDFAASPPDATGSSTPMLTAGSSASTASSPPVTPRPSRSSRAGWPPSRPMPSPR